MYMLQLADPPVAYDCEATACINVSIQSNNHHPQTDARCHPVNFHLNCDLLMHHNLELGYPTGDHREPQSGTSNNIDRSSRVLCDLIDLRSYSRRVDGSASFCICSEWHDLTIYLVPSHLLGPQAISTWTALWSFNAYRPICSRSCESLSAKKYRQQDRLAYELDRNHKPGVAENSMPHFRAQDCSQTPWLLHAASQNPSPGPGFEPIP